jgi:hypothetical protein
MKVAFDIGGVLSKYPDIFRPLVKKLLKAEVDVHIITDMHDLGQIDEMLRLNGFDTSTFHIHSADYATHGEGCKAELLRELGIDIFFDDFIGYVAVPGCPIRCLVMPDATRPYYHESWKGVPGEPEFGRRVYKEKRGPDPWTCAHCQTANGVVQVGVDGDTAKLRCRGCGAAGWGPLKKESV